MLKVADRLDVFNGGIISRGKKPLVMRSFEVNIDTFFHLMALNDRQQAHRAMSAARGRERGRSWPTCSASPASWG
jgi:hypothetical protein